MEKENRSLKTSFFCLEIRKALARYRIPGEDKLLELGRRESKMVFNSFLSTLGSLILVKNIIFSI